MVGVGAKSEYLAPVAAALKVSEGGPATDIISRVEMYTGSRSAGRGAGAPSWLLCEIDSAGHPSLMDCWILRDC
jgi:hypothetical protein